MKSLIFCLFALLSFTFSNDSSFDLELDSDWKLTSSDGDLKVYKRDKVGSSYKEIKIENIMDANVDDVVAAIFSVDDYKKWAYKCSESKIIRKISDNEIIAYTRTDLPIPIWDRDMVAHTTYRQEGGVHYFYTKEALAEKEELDKVVRVTDFYSDWIIKDLGENRTSMINQFHGEPGGNIPAWLINMGVAKGPKKSMANLEMMIKGR